MDDKFAPVTDPAEIDELTNNSNEIGNPYTYKPNGHLWANADELRAWRALRESQK